jgi:hypothetical protein
MIEEQVEIVVSVQPAEAARFVSDPRNELAWNRYAMRIEKTSAGPDRKGSRHRGNYRGAGTFDSDDYLEDGRRSKRRTYPPRIVEKPGVTPPIIL